MRERLALAVLLHFGYWILSFLGAFAIRGMHGSTVAFALLWSFSAMQPLEFGAIRLIPLFLLPFLQVVVYLAVWTLARSGPPKRRRWALSLPVLHLLG